MYKRLILSSIIVIGLFTGINWAEPIEVENFSFELPNAGKQTGFDNVPGWSTDSAVTDSGVETGYTPTEGEWTAFLRSSDPSIWQLTEHTIVQGDVFELKLDARITWVATTLQMILYYDDNGARIPAASAEVAITNTMEEYTLLFSSSDVPESAGHKIGIELVNSSSGDSWLGLDNVRLELVVEGKPLLASKPNPVNNQTDVSLDIILSWIPGENSDKHDVYLGNSYDDVNDATATEDPAGVYLGRFDPNFYPDTGALRLEFGRRYFWRVDEVSAPPDNTVLKGNIWSFRVEPYAVTIPGEDITATASSQSEGRGPEQTVNNSGLDANDLHSTRLDDMWITAEGETGPAWIQYEFDKVYKLNEMFVWNYNGASILYIFGIKDVTVEYSTDGTDWVQLSGVSEFAPAPGAGNYAANTVVPFGNVAAKYVRITAASNWSAGMFNQYGLSEVRFTAIPVSAREPNPEQGAMNIAVDATLGWRAGREAQEHEVYISDDQQAVIDGTAYIDTVSQASYGPLSLDLGSDYYWRIDEVNNAETPASWQSNIWSFTTQQYLVVDGFESYNDIDEGQDGSNLVYLTWVDGYDNPSINGSTIGYVSGASMETAIVHGGMQSVPVKYDNSATNISEVSANIADLSVGNDWTKGDARTLVLWFYGDPNNSTTEQIYVKINNTKVLYDGDPDNVAKRRWTQWDVDLASLGINLSNVTTLGIGFEKTGATGGSGTVLIDDIRLYRTAPPIPIPVDPGSDALVAHYAFENNANDSSGNSLNGTIMGSPIYVQSLAGYGTAIQLDGVDEYVDCGNSTNFDITEEITLSAWVKTSDAGNGEHNPFVTKGDHAYAIKHSVNNEIQFFIYDGDWFTANVDVDSSFNGDWRFVVGTYDGSELRIYIDGGLGDVTPHVGTIEVRTNNLFIGANSEANTRFYNGAIDDVRIYNRALSAGEVLYLADN